MTPLTGRLIVSTLALGLLTVSAPAVEVQLFTATPDAPTQTLLDAFVSHPALRQAEITVTQIPLPNNPRIILESDGRIHLALISLDRLIAAGLVQNAPVITALMQPGQYPGNRVLFDVQDGAPGEALLAEVGRGGTLIGIAYWSRGQTAIVTTAQIRSAKDFRGRTIRTALVSEVANGPVLALGARTIQAPAAQVALAMERGQFDTAELTPAIALAMAEKRQSGTSLATHYRPLLGVLLAERNGWDRLSERQKAAISEAAAAADGIARKVAIEIETKIEATARVQGMPIINLALADADGFRVSNQRNISSVFGDRAALGLQIIQTSLTDVRLAKGGQPPRAPGVTPSAKPTILFVTDRIDEGGNDSRYRFGSKQSPGEPVISCGQAGYVPGSTHTVGIEYKGSIVLGPAALPTGADACKDFVINILKQTNQSRVVLFIHGYNNTFDFSIRRAITSALDIGFGGVVLVWSWPSDGYARAYMRDEAASRRTSRQVPPFVQSLLAHSEVRQLDIVAHSMGSRIALVVLDELRKSKAPPNLGSVVFAAADEERGVFGDVIRAIDKDAPKLGRIRALYAAQYDRPLQVSAMLHGDKRVGLGGSDIMTLAGVESIDATDVEGGFWGALVSLSHAHVFDVPQAINDLRNLLMVGKAASERGLLRRPSGKNEYWVIPK